MSESKWYQNPLCTRYASPQMSELWGEPKKFLTWRELWIALAEAEQGLGLEITSAQIEEMRSAKDQLDLQAARDYEKKFRHDVMAHVHAFGDVAPSARGIIHLGATSCFVTDNTDLLLVRDALQLIRNQLVHVIHRLATFAKQHRDLATLGFTHFQPAQLTTVGKRACLWMQDLLIDLEEIEHRLETMRFRGVKGTTGTQASFLALFNGDHEKVKKLDTMLAARFGFERTFAVTGQTYTRKFDSQVLDVLSGICQSAHKFATDMRLLAHRKELEEPFEKHQIGSSAMAYKRNPMRSERICGLARFVMSLPANAAQTEATQWLERTLDDSANRRLSLPQAFLGTDAVLRLYANIAEGIVVYPKVIGQAVAAELPFMATEEILMAAVLAGGDRQQLHEKIRQHSVAAADQVKNQGNANDLLERLRADADFAGIDWDAVLRPEKFVGRAPVQVDEFLAECVQPVLQRYGDLQPADSSLHV